MNRLSALVHFDVSRSWKWLSLWWLMCLVQIGMAAGLRFDLLKPSFVRIDQLGMLGRLGLVVLIGMMFRPANPARSNSFFRARPIAPGEVFQSRFLSVMIFLLMPRYLTRLIPVLLFDPGIGTVSATTLQFWVIHLGAVAGLAVLAAFFGRTSVYMLVALISYAVLTQISYFVGQVSQHEFAWIAVASPERAQLMWHCGLALAGGVAFSITALALYRGQGSRKKLLGTLGVALLLAAAWRPIEFVQDLSKVGHPIPVGKIDISSLQVEAAHSSHMSSYSTQRNERAGSFSTYVQAKPPYWNKGEERYWFIDGKLEIKGLDPELAFSARLLDAEWTTPDGETLFYAPPSGTFSIRNTRHVLPPPAPTDECLDHLLGQASAGDPADKSPKAAPLNLFGAWTSDFEKYAAIPGRLKMKMKLNLYRHRVGVILPLDQPGTVKTSDGFYRLVEVSQHGEELETRMVKFTSSRRWRVPVGTRWSSYWNSILYDPATGRRGDSSGSSTSNVVLFGSVQERRMEQTFRKGHRHRDNFPDLSRPDSLRLCKIVPQYLGSAEVEVVVDDFALVPERNIEWARRDDERTD